MSLETTVNNLIQSVKDVTVVTATHIKTINGGQVSPLMNPNPNTSTVKFLVEAMREGKCLFKDEDFSTGYNNVYPYDNIGTGNLTVTRESNPTVPNGSGYCLRVTSLGGTSPGVGGFHQRTLIKNNRVYVHIFKAKIPVGYVLWHASNGTGTNSNSGYMGSNEGTGEFQTYCVVTYAGDSGSIDLGFIYLHGPAASPSNPVHFYVASSTVYDITDRTASTITSDELRIGTNATPINSDTVYNNSIGYTDTGVTGAITNQPVPDGGLLTMSYDTSWLSQLYADFRTGRLSSRGKAAGTMFPWNEVQHKRMSFPNNTRIGHNLANLSQYGYHATGALVVLTNITPDHGTMFEINIEGYDYSYHTAAWDLRVSGYVFTDGNFYNYGYTGNLPTRLTDKVRLYLNANRKVCIVIGEVSTVWQMPKLLVKSVTLNHNTVESQLDNWSVELRPVDTWGTAFVNVPSTDKTYVIDNYTGTAKWLPHNTNLRDWVGTKPSVGLYNVYISVAQHGLPATWWYIDLKRHANTTGPEYNTLIATEMASPSPLVLTMVQVGDTWFDWTDSSTFKRNKQVVLADQDTVYDPYAPITVCRSNTGDTRSYYAMVRNGQYAWQTGISADGSYVIGTGPHDNITNSIMSVSRHGVMNTPSGVVLTTGNNPLMSGQLGFLNKEAHTATVATSSYYHGLQLVGSYNPDITNPVGGNAALMSFHRQGSLAINMGLDIDNVFKIAGGSLGAKEIFKLDMNGHLALTAGLTTASGIVGYCGWTNNITMNSSDSAAIYGAAGAMAIGMHPDRKMYFMDTLNQSSGGNHTVNQPMVLDVTTGTLTTRGTIVCGGNTVPTIGNGWGVGLSLSDPQGCAIHGVAGNQAIGFNPDGNTYFFDSTNNDPTTMYYFYLNSKTGNAWLKGTLGQASDERLKTDWVDLDSDFLAKLSNVKHGQYTKIASGDTEVGVSAQSLQEVLPQAVSSDEQGMLSVSYGNAALVSSIQLAKEVISLKSEIAELKELVNSLLSK